MVISFDYGVRSSVHQDKSNDCTIFLKFKKCHEDYFLKWWDLENPTRNRKSDSKLYVYGTIVYLPTSLKYS